ncbi:MAG TPA: YjgP/YjgQ family permease [Firmicutes bacterium]|nr:YjgP/YjgQ family permease [Bacillota bacterium]
MTTLDRYISRELRSLFAFSLAAFTSIFVAGDLLFQVARLFADGIITPWTAVKIFILGLPRIVVITFPMSVLLATLLCFGRLSDGGEIVAMVSGGISRQRLVIPAVVFGAAIALLSSFLNDVVAPRANFAAEEILWRLRGQSQVTVQHNVVIREFEEGRLSRLVVADKLDGATGELSNVTLQEFQDGHLVRITTAPRAKWRGSRWQFMDGVIYNILDGQRVASIRFAVHESRVTQPPDEILRRQRSPDEMGIRDLLTYIHTLCEQGADVKILWVKLYLKLAIPFASIVFALVAAPLGIRLRRSSTSVGFGASIVIIFIYYVIMSLGTAFAEQGAIPAFWGAWAQNFLFGGLGIFLAFRQG